METKFSKGFNLIMILKIRNISYAINSELPIHPMIYTFSFRLLPAVYFCINLCPLHILFCTQSLGGAHCHIMQYLFGKSPKDLKRVLAQQYCPTCPAFLPAQPVLPSTLPILLSHFSVAHIESYQQLQSTVVQCFPSPWNSMSNFQTPASYHLVRFQKLLLQVVLFEKFPSVQHKLLLVLEFCLGKQTQHLVCVSQHKNMKPTWCVTMSLRYISGLAFVFSVF